MSENQSCMVGTLGLFEHEASLVKNILKVSNARNQVRYEYIDSNLEEAHILIVSVTNEAAMEEWQKYAKNSHAPILLVASPKELGKFPGYSFQRPFSPAKILDVLDEICRVELAHLFNEPIFKASEPSRAVEKNPVQQLAPGKQHALVIDDSQMVRSQITRELTAYNLQVDVAESGEQGLEMAENTNYNIIFLDVVMPGIDGYQVCKNLRRNPDRKTTPVVMLTSKSTPFDKVRGSMAGCNAYLTKPVDLEKFHQVLDKYILQKANN